MGRRASASPRRESKRSRSSSPASHLTDFFARYVDGTEDPPLEALLAQFGVTYRLRPRTAIPTVAASAARRRAMTSPDGWLGASLAGGAEPVLQHVYNGGPAEQAGLAAGDSIVAIDGLRMSVGAIEKLRRGGARASR
jgi:predicted metalloprotease with PDZ domain